MSPAEYIELLQNGGINVATHAMNFIALMFAYLITAYFVGTKLNRYQVWAVSILYSVFVVLPARAAVLGLEQILSLTEMFYRDHPAVAEEFYGEVFTVPVVDPRYLAVILLVAWAVSLGFMISERWRHDAST
jgi:hypothetical protein